MMRGSRSVGSLPSPGCIGRGGAGRDPRAICQGDGPVVKSFGTARMDALAFAPSIRTCGGVALPSRRLFIVLPVPRKGPQPVPRPSCIPMSRSAAPGLDFRGVAT